jgi:small subunit ribosomal protein S14
MARRAMIIKANRKPKFMTRTVRRCRVCGRARSVYRKFQLCRICFRTNANVGYLPGVRKASW